ncbi:MAG: hypothetical protein PHC51_08495 [bacterium]|nr:hypothetical protein [bacterium]
MNNDQNLLNALHQALRLLVANSDLETELNESGNVILRRKKPNSGKSVSVNVTASAIGMGIIKIARVLVEEHKFHSPFESYNSPSGCTGEETINWCIGIMPTILAREPDTDELAQIGFRTDVPEGIGFGR